jgi:acyl-coenzyme A thioesterase PaaI-like protein
LNPHGLHIRTVMDGEEGVLRFTPQPQHMALPGFVYGGLIASLIDCHGIGTAAAYFERKAGRRIGDGPAPRFVTGSLQVDFLAPTPLGPELEIRARVREAGERKAVVDATVTAAGRLTARGQVVAVRLPESMRPG